MQMLGTHGEIAYSPLLHPRAKDGGEDAGAHVDCSALPILLRIGFTYGKSN